MKSTDLKAHRIFAVRFAFSGKTESGAALLIKIV